MAKVTFLPMGVAFDALEGESVLDVALNNGVPIQHACGGFCACATCQVNVREGASCLSSMDGEENERLDMAEERKPESRLACQSKISGDIVVEVVNLE